MGDAMASITVLRIPEVNNKFIKYTLPVEKYVFTLF
jgi:hypothetical protein